MRNRIKEICDILGITSNEYALKVGISSSMAESIFNQKQIYIPLYAIHRTSEIFGVTSEYLFYME